MIWKKVINRKFEEKEGEWRSCEMRDSHGVKLWKDIRKEWDLFSTSFSVQYLMGVR